MAIAAKISPTELEAQVESRFVGKYLEARLINAPGTQYIPGTTVDATFLGFEVPITTGGYRRAVISYGAGDVTDYSDDGIALNTKATTFAQDGSATPINFSHVALCWSSGNALGLGSPSVVPGVGADGTYTNVPMDTSTANGNSLTVNITVSNGGATVGDYSISIQQPGTGFIVGETVTITEATLVGIGLTTIGSGGITFQVSSVSTNADSGNIVGVAQTATAATLSGGNEAVFYWNLKQFGFYSTSV